MTWLLVGASLLIQAVAIIMVLYTFRAVNEKKWPKLSVLERYHLMRQRYDRLRYSLLFVAALILVQLIGLIYYLGNPSGPITLAQLLVSDLVFIALVVFLSRIYLHRHTLEEHPAALSQELDKKVQP